MNPIPRSGLIREVPSVGKKAVAETCVMQIGENYTAHTDEMKGLEEQLQTHHACFLSTA